MHATFTPHGGSQAKIGQDGKVQDRAEVALQLRGAVRKQGTEAAESQPTAAGKSKTQAPAEQQENANDRGLAPEGRTEESQQAESPAGTDEGQHSEEAPPGESNRVKRKWKAALDKKKAAESERDAMAQEVAALKAQLDAIQRGQQPQPQAQPQKAAALEFKEPFPEDGTMEQQAAWHGRKAAHDQMRQMFPALFLEHAQPAFRNFAQVLEPALKFSVSEMGNREWKEMQPILDSVGAEVQEVRPVVEALLEQNPQLGIHDALGRVLFDPAYRAHWQEVGPPEAAGKPAKAPARSPARPGASRPGPAVEGLSPQELVAASQEARRTGNFHQRSAYMAQLLKGAVKKKRA